MSSEKGAIELIADERIRQMAVEGWTAAHDDTHQCDEMAWAAVCYAYPEGYKDLDYDCIPNDWPWRDDPTSWKPGPTRIRDLVKAGALIAAEIDRLQRLEHDHAPELGGEGG